MTLRRKRGDGLAGHSDADGFEEELVLKGEALLEGGIAGVAVGRDPEERRVGRAAGGGPFEKAHPVESAPLQEIVVVHCVKPVLPLRFGCEWQVPTIFAERRAEGCDVAHKEAKKASRHGSARRGNGGKLPHPQSHRGEEGAVRVDQGVRHAGSVEADAGIAVSVEEDDAAGAFAALGEELHGGLNGAGRCGNGRAEKIAGGLGEDHAHDGFAVASGRNSAGLLVGVTAAADERRIADASGKLAAGAAGGRGGEEAPLFIEGNGADGALLVPAMVLGGMRVDAATFPGFALGKGDKFRGMAQRDALFVGEFFGAFADEHHMRGFFEDGARGLNGILDAAESRDRASLERGGVHHDGVAFDEAVEVQVRAVTRVEDGVVFENGDGGLDGVKGVAAVGEDGPTGVKSAKAAFFAGVNGVVGDVPGTTVHDKRGAHVGRGRISDI